MDISCKLSPTVTICMKCQSLFSEQNKKNINLSSAKFVQRKVKLRKYGVPFAQKNSHMSKLHSYRLSDMLNSMMEVNAEMDGRMNGLKYAYITPLTEQQNYMY